MRRLLVDSMRQDSPARFRRALGLGVVLVAICFLAGCETRRSGNVGRIEYAMPSNVLEATNLQAFRDYDIAFIDKVQKKWNDLLNQGVRSTKRGVVVVQFKLTPDGNILDVRVTRNTADSAAAWFSNKAILDAAPYSPWPEEMRKTIKAESREMQFSFNYLK